MWHHEYEVFYDNFIKLHYLATLRGPVGTSTGQRAVPYLMFNEISIKKDSIYNAKSNKILFIIFCNAILLVKWGLKTSIINKLKCLKLVKYCIVLNVSFM